MNDLRARRTLLQTRCSAQRQLLAQRVADVEQRLRGSDAVLSVARNVLSKSAAIAGGTALWWSARSTGWWGLVTRGVALLAAARRVYGMFRAR